MINVCLTIDDKYTEYCATTITSVLENSESLCHFYIISSDLTPINRDRLMFLRNLKDCDISIITPAEKRINKLKEYYVPPKSHFNYVNYLRIMIPSLLDHVPVNKTIYLDSDLIVVSDLKELWNIPQDDAYILGCEPMNGDKDRKRLGLSSDKPYINSGVMVMDLNKFHKDNIEDRIFKFIDNFDDKPEILRNIGQDPINYVLSEIKGGIKIIPQNWNVEFRSDMVTDHEYIFIQHDPHIYHFITEDKPWKKDTKQIHKVLWRKYNDIYKNILK